MRDCTLCSGTCKGEVGGAAHVLTEDELEVVEATLLWAVKEVTKLIPRCVHSPNDRQIQSLHPTASH